MNKLTSAQINNFKQELIKLRNAIMKTMQLHQDDLIIVDQDLETYVDAVESASIRSKQTDILAAIDLALLKISHGTYGICEETDEPIPVKRLEIIPYTQCTVEGEMMRKTGKYPN